MTAATTDNDLRRTGFEARLRTAITVWAILGGFFLLAVVLVNTLSVVLQFFWKPISGDLELTELGVAIAAFMFLPYCQLIGANVTADIFTSKAPPYVVALLKLVAAFVALAFATLLLWSMYGGMMSRLQYGNTTAILQVPIWWAYVPGVMSWVLLIVASIISILDILRELRVVWTS
ncbi:MAG: TRAP transporter small permease subunit [Rhodobacteraceae bacterium]|nr:TRAP transporter small permease subunit [Paracoccaceae bacterium]